MVVVAVRGVGTLGAELRDLHLTFVDDRTVVQLAPLNDGLGVCRSARVWARRNRAAPPPRRVPRTGQPARATGVISS